jgi:hypothetical protein
VRMTAHHRADTLREPVPGRSEPDERGLPDSTILSMCDELLGEVGRRDHIFHWLRAPGADIDEWLPVDAYYPRARLVVMCRSDLGEHESVFRQLVPARGLTLMRLNPAILGSDQETVREALVAKIFDLEHGPRGRARPERASGERVRGLRARGERVRGERARSKADPEGRPQKKADPKERPQKTADPAGRAEKPRPFERSDQRPPEPDWSPVKVEHTPVPRGYVHGAGVLAGLALAAVLIAELYLGVIVVAFHDSRLLLGLAIALDACSRMLGTAAAERAGRRGWAFACAIVGAPVVAWFALLRPSGRMEVEPAPLAGLLAALAIVVAVIGILIGS